MCLTSILRIQRRAQGLGFGGLGFRVQDLRFRVGGSYHRILGGPSRFACSEVKQLPLLIIRGFR